MKRIYDLLIIGGGPGGYTAALYAARAGLSVVVLEKLSAGGQMALTEEIDNYPGFENGIDGFELGDKMQRQAERFGAETVLADVLSVKLSGDVKSLETSEGTYEGRAVVIATGAKAKPLGLANEEKLSGKGVHYCAACDGMRYRGKTVAVIGGGNSAVADALTLSRVAKQVILVHRRDTLRATKVYHKAMEAAENVKFRWNSQVVELENSENGISLKLKDTASGQVSNLEVDGVFISIGRAPATSSFEGQVELDEQGYIKADADTKTNLPGVFAVGDVRTTLLRQIVTAVADGAVAAHQAEGYLSLF